MYRVTFELGGFNGTRDAEESLAALAAMLECLITIDTEYLRRRPTVPLLYQSGVRYEEEPLGAEFWRDIPTVLKYGTADCEDLACWLVAEKRVRFGILATARIVPQLGAPTPALPNGRFVYHIVVATPDVPGGVDDPSRRLGMR